jgi:hypothetical protein
MSAVPGDVDVVLATLRGQAWERAKGELQAVMATYWNDSRYGLMELAIAEFVKRVEDHGLAE